MHVYPRRRNVAAEMAEDTYATPPMEERRKENCYCTQNMYLFIEGFIAQYTRAVPKVLFLD